MAKTKKAKQDLERIVLNRCRDSGIQIQSVTVFPSAVHGWEANFMASATLVMGYLERFETIVREIRSEFDLKD